MVLPWTSHHSRPTSRILAHMGHSSWINSPFCPWVVHALPIGLSWAYCAVRLDWVRGGSYQKKIILPIPPAQCPARVWVSRSLFEAQDCCFFVFDQISPCRRPRQLRAGRRPGYTVHSERGTRICVIVCFFFAFVLHLQLNSSPPRGAVGSVTFRFGYLSFPHSSPRYAGGPWEVLGLVYLVIAPKYFLQLQFFALSPAAESIHSKV